MQPRPPKAPRPPELRQQDTTEIPFVPKNISINQLHPNFKLFSDDQIQAIQYYCQNFPDGQIPRSQYTHLSPNLQNAPYSIVKQGVVYYALDNKPLAAGSFGEFRLMQNLSTGEWSGKKSFNTDVTGLDANSQAAIAQDQSARGDQEYKNLSNVGMARGGYARDKIIRARRPGEIDRVIRQDSILMPYAGADLEQEKYKAKKMPTVRCLEMFDGALGSLQQVHASGFLHRDIKPANITRDAVTGKTRLIDYGLLLPKNQVDIAVVGTPAYMAQESKTPPPKYTESSDVYGLGMSLADTLGLTKLEHDPNLQPPLNEKFVIVPADSNQFKNNTWIQDPRTREAVRVYLQKMTDPEPANRPTVAEARAFFKDLKVDYLSTPEQTVRTAYIHVEEFAMASPQQKAIFFEQMRAVDEVVLIDQNNQRQNWYPHAKREIEEAGFQVHNQVLQYGTRTAPNPDPNVDLAEATQIHRFNRERRESKGFDCILLRPDRDPQPAASLHLIQVNKVLKVLSGDMQRLRAKYGSKADGQCKDIMVTAERIKAEYKTGTLSYRKMNPILDDLQGKLLARANFNYALGKNLNVDVRETGRKVQAIKQELQQDEKSSFRPR